MLAQTPRPYFHRCLFVFVKKTRNCNASRSLIHRVDYQATPAPTRTPRRWKHNTALPGFGGSLQLSEAQQRTIYAVATPPGRGGVAVVRISGPDVLTVYQRMVKKYTSAKRTLKEVSPSAHEALKLPEPRKMARCTVVDPCTGADLDDGLVVFFKSPRSFTTEDVLELHVHSGRAILSAVLGALARIPGLRPAERGEFTRRAFAGGRMDLTQVEGLRDLVDAETEEQRRVAVSAVRGTVRKRFENMRQEIVNALALIEALIDFGEGEDIEEGVYAAARVRVENLHAHMVTHLSDSRRGEILRSGVTLAIFGPPNAGKSSLLNFLAQRDAAIVTDMPGTTRDVLELTLDIGGLAVVVADTAGLRPTEDVVERIGVQRAKDRVAKADAALCVLSLPELHDTGVPAAVAGLLTPSTFVLLNKADLCRGAGDSPAHLLAGCAGVWTASLSTGAGMDVFVRALGDALRARYDLLAPGAEPLITHARHRAHLETARGFLEAFLATGPEDVVLGAEELRYAAQAVGRITGTIDVEEVLDAVFRKFCIGK